MGEGASVGKAGSGAEGPCRGTAAGDDGGGPGEGEDGSRGDAPAASHGLFMAIQNNQRGPCWG